MLVRGLTVAVFIVLRIYDVRARIDCSCVDIDVAVFMLFYLLMLERGLTVAVFIEFLLIDVSVISNCSCVYIVCDLLMLERGLTVPVFKHNRPLLVLVVHGPDITLPPPSLGIFKTVIGTIWRKMNDVCIFSHNLNHTCNNCHKLGSEKKQGWHMG